MKGSSQLPPPSVRTKLKGSETSSVLTAQSRTPTPSWPALNASLLGGQGDVVVVVGFYDILVRASGLRKHVFQFPGSV